MKQLKGYVAGWKELLAKSQEQLARLLRLKALTTSVRDQNDMDVLDKRIEQEDYAVNQYQRALTYSESRLGQAQGGQDV
jgi:hypothetical protein